MYKRQEDGREYEITRITDARRAASLKAGGVGMRYTCMVEGKAVHLYYEEMCIRDRLTILIRSRRSRTSTKEEH